MQCPSCGHDLRTTDYEGVPVETCDGCDGEWVDKLELGDIILIREKRFSPEERQAISAATPTTGVDLSQTGRSLVCPKCGEETQAINYGGTSGIILDRCAGCGGFWLDAGELEKVQMLVEGWEDQLPEDMAGHGAKLRNVETGLGRERQRSSEPDTVGGPLHQRLRQRNFGLALTGGTSRETRRALPQP